MVAPISHSLQRPCSTKRQINNNYPQTPWRAIRSHHHLESHGTPTGSRWLSKRNLSESHWNWTFQQLSPSPLFGNPAQYRPNILEPALWYLELAHTILRAGFPSVGVNVAASRKKKPESAGKFGQAVPADPYIVYKFELPDCTCFDRNPTKISSRTKHRFYHAGLDVCHCVCHSTEILNFSTFFHPHSSWGRFSIFILLLFSVKHVRLGALVPNTFGLNSCSDRYSAMPFSFSDCVLGRARMNPPSSVVRS